jgi:uncharacterized membrane protein
MGDVVLARVLHVLGVVVWIGGVWFVTAVVLPAVRRGDLGENRLRAFEGVEHRFAPQARLAILLVGATGFYMAARLDLWDRFRAAEFWWMHAMVFVWLLFTIGLFIVEPFVIRRRFDRWAAAAPTETFAWLNMVHWVLLVLSLGTVAGAVAGSQGWSGF